MEEGKFSGTRLPEAAGEAEERVRGNPLFCKKVLRSRRPCTTGHRAISKALSFKMHYGPTPSGPHPFRQKLLYGWRCVRGCASSLPPCSYGSDRPPCRAIIFSTGRDAGAYQNREGEQWGQVCSWLILRAKSRTNSASLSQEDNGLHI